MKKPLSTNDGQQGWGEVQGGRKYHYFTSSGRSLCGRYLYLGSPEFLYDEKHNHPDNCATCKKKYAAAQSS